MTSTVASNSTNKKSWNRSIKSKWHNYALKPIQFKRRCLLHVLSLMMVAFGTTLLGEALSLHWGCNTPPYAIALILFLRYVKNREWKDLHEAY